MDRHTFKPSSSTRNLPAGFWDSFTHTLYKQWVKNTAARWYVRRIGQFLDAHEGLSCAHINREIVDRYLQGLGRQGQQSGWQFRQTVDALRLFCSLCRLNAATEVDWEHWLASARSLAPDHRSIARQDVQQVQEQVSGSRIVAKSSDTFAPLIHKLIVAIRMKKRTSKGRGSVLGNRDIGVRSRCVASR